jgi:ABC-2 type transport system ATP-binding protein
MADYSLYFLERSNSSTIEKLITRDGNDFKPNVVFSGMTSEIPAIKLENLQKRFGSVTAVSNINLDISQGQLYGLLGPNGAGKTTTLRMIAGLLKPDTGDVQILGLSVTKQPKLAKQPLAYLPDDPLLYGKLRPLEYLEFVAGLWGIEASTAAPKAASLLEMMGLWNNRLELVEGFSRGMKQKLALAGALVHEPKIMILDEPLTGLDAAAARQVKDLLVDYVKAGNTVVLTTHILEVAERLADRIGIIARGALIAEGTLEELRSKSHEVGAYGAKASLEDVFLELTQVGEPQ